MNRLARRSGNSFQPTDAKETRPFWSIRAALRMMLFRKTPRRWDTTRRNIPAPFPAPHRSEERTSELQSLMRNSYAVFCLKKKINQKHTQQNTCQHLARNKEIDARYTN